MYVQVVAPRAFYDFFSRKALNGRSSEVNRVKHYGFTKLHFPPILAHFSWQSLRQNQIVAYLGSTQTLTREMHRLNNLNLVFKQCWPGGFKIVPWSSPSWAPWSILKDEGVPKSWIRVSSYSQITRDSDPTIDQSSITKSLMLRKALGYDDDYCNIA